MMLACQMVASKVQPAASYTEPIMPEMYPYQRAGAQWLASKKYGLLADEMRLGKSVQTAVACDLIGAKNILIVCPAVARHTWIREFEIWSSATRESMAITTSKSEIPAGGLVTVSYDLVRVQKALSALRRTSWDVLVLDESHYVKTPKALMSKAIFNKLWGCCSRVWALSGTPAPSHIGELWLLLNAFGSTTLNRYAFEDKYCNVYKGHFGRVIQGTKRSAIPEIRKMLGGCMLRRKMVDVLPELPKLSSSEVVVTPNHVDVDMWFHALSPPWNPNPCRVIDQLLKEEAVIEGIAAVSYSAAHDLDSVNGAFTKSLDAISNSVATWRRYTGLSKTQGTADLIRADIDAGRYTKVVVFAWHKDVIHDLQIKLKAACLDFVTVYGGTPDSSRKSALKRFNENSKCHVFIGNLMSAGTNIDLSIAHDVIIIEPSWVPAHNAQAIMRTHHVKQSHPVRVRYVTIDSKLDTRITRVLKRKTAELTAVFD